MSGDPRKTAVRLFAVTAFLYALTNYGGIRSSDAEIVFRTGESLATSGGFAIQELENWPGFGVAKGVDGRWYGIYPPLQSIAAAPLIGLARLMNSTGWYRSSAFRVPVSHYAERGLVDALRNRPPADPGPHALRFIVSFFNSIVGALGVVVFWSIARRFMRWRSGALGLAVLYAFGTLLWTYADTFFTEPLALLLVLLSFRLLVGQDPGIAQASPRMRPGAFAASGTALGLAGATHPTALLFVPFFLGYAWLAGSRREDAQRAAVRALLSVSAGLALVLGLLALHNFVRFGNPLEDGRGLSQMNANTFFGPWTREYWSGAWGLLLSAHKGLFIYCPAVLLGFLGWRHFRRGYAALAWILAALLITRWLLIASFAAWDAGFCLGPRYLLMEIPFLLLPAAALLDRLRPPDGAGKLMPAAAFALCCILQQLWFCTGEIFTYYHFVKINLARMHLQLTDRALYMDWSTSPAFHLLDFRKGPFLFQGIPLSGWTVWGLGALILSTAFALAYRPWLRSTDGS